MDSAMKPELIELTYDTKNEGLIFENIKKNNIVCSKKQQNKYIVPRELLELTAKIGQYVYEKNILLTIKRDSFVKELEQISNAINDSFFYCSDMKSIIEKQIEKLKNILSQEKTRKKDVDNEELLKQKQLSEKFYNLIIKWFNNYGIFLNTSSETKQYYNLYDFLEFTNYIFTIVDEFKECPPTKFSRYVEQKNEGYVLKYKYDSIKDYIIGLAQLTITGYYNVGYCEFCGFIIIGKRKGVRTCSQVCRNLKSKKRGKV